MNIAKTQEEQKKAEERREPTPQEIAAYQEQMMSFYKSQLPFLRKQAEHKRLMADIAEDSVRKLMSDMKYAEIMGQQPTPEQLRKLAHDKEIDAAKKEELSKSAKETAEVKS